MRFYDEREQELAVAVGHQLAHALFDRDEDDRLTKERRADHFGLILTAGSGYDVTPAIAYWEAVAQAHPSLIDPLKWQPATTQHDAHAAIAARVDAIRDSVRKLQSP